MLTYDLEFKSMFEEVASQKQIIIYCSIINSFKGSQVRFDIENTDYY
jgi:hypothetical protein